MTRSLFLPPLLLALLAPAASADVLNVGGPNPNHSQIKAAVLASQDGDVIRVWPGVYGALGINDRSLTIVSVNGGSSVRIDGTLRIRNLSPQRSVALSGINVKGLDGYALIVTDCAGSIRIADASLVGGVMPGDEWVPSVAYSAAYLATNEDMALNRCSFRGGPAATGGHGGFGTSAFISSESNIAAFECAFTASPHNYESHGGDGNSGSDAALVRGDRFYASACSFVATSGEDGDAWSGGAGGSAGNAFFGYGGVSAWFLDCAFQPGQGGSGVFGQEADGVNFTVGTPLPGDARLLTAPSLLDDTAALALRFSGTPGDIVSLRVRRGPGSTFDPILGPLLLRSNNHLAWRILGQIPASGTLLVNLPPRTLPAQDYETLHFQGLLVGVESYYTTSVWSTRVGPSW